MRQVGGERGARNKWHWSARCHRDGQRAFARSGRKWRRDNRREERGGRFSMSGSCQTPLGGFRRFAGQMKRSKRAGRKRRAASGERTGKVEQLACLPVQMEADEG